MSGPRRAPAPPLRLRLRSEAAARRAISYDTKTRKPDGGWGHTKRPRRGQCKRPERETSLMRFDALTTPGFERRDGSCATVRS